MVFQESASEGEIAQKKGRELGSWRGLTRYFLGVFPYTISRIFLEQARTCHYLCHYSFLGLLKTFHVLIVKYGSRVKTITLLFDINISFRHRMAFCGYELQIT